MPVHRSRQFVSALLATVVLGACGGGSDDSSASASSAATAGAPASGATADSSGQTTAAATGDVDCSVLTPEDVTRYGYDVQLLAGIGGDAQIDALRDNGLDYSPEELADILNRMHVLDGRDAEGQGDPAEAIDLFQDLNDRVGVMIDTPSPVPQALIDDYLAASGGISGVLTKQLPINAALAEYCPELLS